MYGSLKYAFLFLLGTIVFSSTANAEIRPEDEAGIVSRLDGVALAIQDAFPRPLKKGEKIYVGDILSTGKSSRLEIEMKDGSVFNLGERASFNVIDFTFYTGEDAGKSSGVFRLLKGAVNGATGKLASLGSGMQIMGDAATIGIRGTAFWIGDMPDGSLGVVHWQGGGLDVSNAKGTVRIDGNGEGSEIKDGDTAPGAPKFWRRWKREFARWTVAFDPGEPPEIPSDAKK